MAKRCKDRKECGFKSVDLKYLWVTEWSLANLGKHSEVPKNACTAKSAEGDTALKEAFGPLVLIAKRREIQDERKWSTVGWAKELTGDL